MKLVRQLSLHKVLEYNASKENSFYRVFLSCNISTISFLSDCLSIALVEDDMGLIPEQWKHLCLFLEFC